jgi:hypothetical protein
MKRLSTSMDTQFRGKVQMTLASIFPSSEKSGVNQKGLYNTNINIQLSDAKGVNSHFYKQFWILIKYLTNPFQVEFINLAIFLKC